MSVGQFLRQVSSRLTRTVPDPRATVNYIPLESVERSSVELINGTAHRRITVPHESFGHGFEVPDVSSIPSKGELATLRRVSDDIPLATFLIVAVELCDRAAFYGLGGVVQNYLQNPLPTGGSGTGAPARIDDPAPAGALGLGQSKASALQQILGTFGLICPIFGAYIADAKWGRYKTIIVFCGVYFVGLALITVSAIPASLRAGFGLPGFIFSGLIIGLGAGGVKANVSPLVADQYQKTEMSIRILDTGERVIVDPDVTISRIYNIFYWIINVGCLSAIITTQLERRFGFWAAFLLPLCIFLVTPVIFVLGSDLYHTVSPHGSIFVEVYHVVRIAFRGTFSNPLRFLQAIRNPSVWDRAKPSRLFREGDNSLVARHDVTWDDAFVDELRRTAQASQISFFMPLYWIAYNQMTTNLISQAATMTTKGTPNDFLANFNPIALIIFIPVMDYFIYPALRRAGIVLRPIFRIWLGFMFAALAMAYSATLQFYIYRTNPCGAYVGSCEEKSTISVWVQVPSYILIAISETFAAITCLEYSYNKAPKRMKSVVMSFFMFTSALGNIITALTATFAQDPHLVENYVGIGFVTFVAGNVFYLVFRERDLTEEADNAIGREVHTNTNE